jgi:hypothetical protein
MKIMILGVGKSGTTAILYKVAGGLPNCHAFSGGHPGKHIGNYENAVYKHTYEERKGKTFDRYREHFQKEKYDRKVWIARDPRDSVVSRMLYRWHKGYRGRKKQYLAHLDLVLKKEKDPGSVPFHKICRYTSHNSWPITTEEVINEERIRCERMHDFVKSLGGEWFLFKYEDMVNGNFEALNTYLGFPVQADAEVPKSTGKAKVVRKKSIGDWRHWFTEEDVELFKPAFLPYMQLIGYDCDDWGLSPVQVIEPEYSSEYIMRLPRMKTANAIRRVKDILVQRLLGKS